MLMNQGISRSSNELLEMTSSLFPQHISPNHADTTAVARWCWCHLPRCCYQRLCCHVSLGRSCEFAYLQWQDLVAFQAFFMRKSSCLQDGETSGVRDVVSSFDCLSYCLRPLKSFGAGFKASTCMVGWMWFWDARTFQIMQKLSAWSTALTCFHIFVVDISVD